MTRLLKIVSLLFFLTIISCNQNNSSATEKENELLKKENELLKKEQELNSKDKAAQTINTNSTPSSSSDSWKTFNHKYGFALELPNYFKEGSLTASGIQYYINDLNDNITIMVETVGEGSNASLKDDYQFQLKSSEGCDYKILKDNWFVLSGQDKEGIYYQKTILKNGQTHYLSIRYPTTQKDIFDNILPRISKSFK